MSRVTFAENIKRLFGNHSKIDDSFFDDLADSLIEGDLGPKASFEAVTSLKKICAAGKIDAREEILAELVSLLSGWAKETSFEPPEGKVSVYLVLGVNGVGKTTSVAKMAAWYKQQYPHIPLVLAAADTFRAAAIAQLKMHGDRTGVRVVAHQDGGDPGAVVFDAADAVSSSGGGLVIVDTAGRLHNKENLVRELQKIDRIAASKASPGCYKKILVLDATTGQNGLRQAEVFNEAVGVDAIILTKYDSTARGGIALSAGRDYGIPVIFVGTGETYADFGMFDKAGYLRDFVGLA